MRTFLIIITLLLQASLMSAQTAASSDLSSKSESTVRNDYHDMAPYDTTMAVASDTAADIREAELRYKQCLSKGDKEWAARNLFFIAVAKDSINSLQMAQLIKETHERMQVDQKIAAEKQHQYELRQLMWRIISFATAAFAIIFLVVALSLQRMAGKLRKSNDELVATNAKLKQANAEAQASLGKKEEFIRHISHEVRTPLNIIGGFAQILSVAGPNIPKENLDDIHARLADSGKNITDIMKKITALSDADQFSKIELADECPCTQLCREAIALSEIEDNESVHFTFDTSMHESCIIRTNREVVVDILTELLNNAQRFNQHGNITLSYQKPAHRMVRFTVTDDGAHISDADSERIFEAFAKLNDFDQGIGAGLTICRSMARRMGGSLIFDTSYTEGNSFILELHY